MKRVAVTFLVGFGVIMAGAVQTALQHRPQKAVVRQAASEKFGTKVVGRAATR